MGLPAWALPSLPAALSGALSSVNCSMPWPKEFSLEEGRVVRQGTRLRPVLWLPASHLVLTPGDLQHLGGWASRRWVPQWSASKKQNTFPAESLAQHLAQSAR